MKSLSRNVAIAMFFAFAVGSIYGCAEQPITFTGPGVQIWKLNVYDDKGLRLNSKDLSLILKPSETEKDVFHVTTTIDTEIESDMWGNARVFLEWKGEIRNGAMTCNITGTSVSYPTEWRFQFIWRSKRNLFKKASFRYLSI